MRSIVCMVAGLAFLFFVSSCGKSTCLNPGVRITFSGYDSSELSTVLISQYARNTNFSTLTGIAVLDTTYLDIYQSGDTTYRPKIDTSGYSLAPGFDYVIALPAAKKTHSSDTVFTISSISYSQVKSPGSKGGAGGCTNNVSYYLDSLPYQKKGGSFSQSTLPPVKIVLSK